MSRSYGQYCGLARALDVVGDRWNLLVVRQLLIAPARYGDLLMGLPGIATNLLADRLRALESAGVVERRLDPSSNGVVYALTRWGVELREPVEGLIRWSTPLMVRGVDGDTFDSDWLIVALPALFEGRIPRRTVTVGFATGDGMVQVRSTETGIHVERHDGRALDAVLRGDPAVLLGLVRRLLTFDMVAELVEIEGDASCVHSLISAA